jgi:hypothetical protein
MNFEEYTTKSAINAINKELQREVYGTLLNPVIETEYNEETGIIFATVHAICEKAPKQHRYFLFAFYQGEKLYMASNVIDIEFKRSLNDAKAAAQNHYNRFANKLNTIK